MVGYRKYVGYLSIRSPEMHICCKCVDLYLILAVDAVMRLDKTFNGKSIKIYVLIQECSPEVIVCLSFCQLPFLSWERWGNSSWSGHAAPHRGTKVIAPWCCINVSVNWVSIGSGNGLSRVRHQAVNWTNADLLSTGLLGTNFSENWIGIHLRKCIWNCRLPKTWFHLVV